MAKRTRRPLRRSEKLFLACLALGAMAGGGLYWLWPVLPWWVYALAGAIIAGFLYEELLRTCARERLLDGERGERGERG